MTTDWQPIETAPKNRLTLGGVDNALCFGPRMAWKWHASLGIGMKANGGIVGRMTIILGFGTSFPLGA